MKPSAQDILAVFIEDVRGGKRGDDSQLEAILLKHLLLQGGFKIVPREPGDQALIAAARAITPDDIWREMWDVAEMYELEESESYIPA